MRKPDFFVVGAPKCGSAPLIEALGRHPQVFVPARKDPHFFNTDMRHRFVTEETRYNSLFEDAAPAHRAVGEGSNWYLYSRNAIRAIEAYSDSPPRYVVCLRNPIEMASALHAHLVWSGNESESDFARAWALSKRRRRGLDLPHQSTDDGQMLNYPLVCALGTQLTRLYERVPRNRVHVVLLDDLKADSAAVFDGVQRFLGLDPVADIHITPSNRFGARRAQQALRQGRGLGVRRGLMQVFTPLKRRLWRDGPVPDALRGELAANFAPEMALLQGLLDRDLSHWHLPAAGARADLGRALETARD